MRYITCPDHPGVIVENRPCPLCAHPQVAPEGRLPYRSEWQTGREGEPQLNPAQLSLNSHTQLEMKI